MSDLAPVGTVEGPCHDGQYGDPHPGPPIDREGLMSTTGTTERSATTRTPARTRGGAPVFSALAGISALAVILQGLWAGIFLEHDGHRDAASSWIDVHARGGDVALAFAVLATLYAFWKHRERRDLWIGGAFLSVLLVLEAWLGGQIRDEGADTLTAVHVPLAMVIMALATWLPIRARR
jgi:hypothetical protein